MAPSGEDAVEDALNILKNVTNMAGNLRNVLRKDMLKAVSDLRKELAKLKCEVEDKNKLVVDLERKLRKRTIYSTRCRQERELTVERIMVRHLLAGRSTPRTAPAPVTGMWLRAELGNVTQM